MAGTGRFDPTNESLRASLAWHSEITLRLQQRVLEAQKYVKAHSGDPKLLAILDGDEPSNLWRGVDTSALFDLDAP